MDRLVTNYVATPDGSLVKAVGASWRAEHALGEADLHRRLAAISPSSGAVATAASKYGPLRLGADIAHIIPDATWNEVGLGLGQASLAEWIAAEDWVDRGCAGPTPPILVQHRQLVLAIAAWPPALRRGIGLSLDRADAAEIEQAAREADQELGTLDAVSFMTSIANSFGGSADITSPWPVDREGLEWAVHYAVRVQSMLGGLEPMPAEVERGLVVRVAITAGADLLQPIEEGLSEDNILGRLVKHLREETTDGWLLVSREMAAWVAAIQLRKQADRGRLRAGITDLRSLVDLLLDGVAFGTEDAHTTGELESLLRPRFQAKLEARLQAAGAWPYPADRVIGTYARALWSVWFEFTDDRPPQRCATPACDGSFPAHGSRRYCDTCRLLRDRSRKSRPTSSLPATTQALARNRR
jgi:hypothetical protein